MRIIGMIIAVAVGSTAMFIVIKVDGPLLLTGLIGAALAWVLAILARPPAPRWPRTRRSRDW